MEDSTGSQDGDKTSPYITERSLSPDLVSLSSTSGSETESNGESQREALLNDAAATPIAPNESHATEQSRLAAHSGASRSSDRTHSGASEGRDQENLSSSFQDSQSSGSVDLSSVEISPQYQLLDKDKLKASDYESTGLLYARSSKSKHNV